MGHISELPGRVDGIENRVVSNAENFKKSIKESLNSNEEFNIVVEINSFHKYIEYIEIQQRVLGNSTNPLIFRGHSNINFPLIPSIMRDGIFSKTPNGKDIHQYEKKLMYDFEIRAYPHIDYFPRENVRYWELLARAQHHYLPTRFLDWTERAAIALYFSVQEKFDSFACVWAITSPEQLNVKEYKNSKKLETVMLYRPPHIVPRIMMQQGCFTVHPDNYRIWNKKWIVAPRVLYVICKEYRENILFGLNAAGINEAALFPDMDGITRYIKQTVKP